MNKTENFNRLIDQAMSLEDHTHMRPVIEKELLHYDVLFALDQEGLLDSLTFQGGTSLRLCYGASRFSEDLDFVGGKDFSTARLIDLKTCIEHYIGGRYGFEVSIKEPKDTRIESGQAGVKVDKWQISIITAPERKHIPQQKIKLEVVNIPAYTREPRALQMNYPFLPDGYSDMLIMVESLNEIMADKLISLVNCTRYVRHRDIWDLRWLVQQGAEIRADLVKSKISDYHIINYVEKLDDMREKLETIVQSKAFLDEMSRFIPVSAQEQTLKKEKFLVFLASETKRLLDKTKQLFNS